MNNPKSRNCFLRSVKTADFPPNMIRCSAWLRRLQAIPHRATVNIDEGLAKGFDMDDVEMPESTTYRIHM